MYLQSSKSLLFNKFHWVEFVSVSTKIFVNILTSVLRAEKLNFNKSFIHLFPHILIHYINALSPLSRGSILREGHCSDIVNVDVNVDVNIDFIIGISKLVLSVSNIWVMNFTSLTVCQILSLCCEQYLIYLVYPNKYMFCENIRVTNIQLWRIFDNET